ncbi:tRNA pseudouridine(38-40) synthase TruA [Alteribacillus sp. HJP-4]|uniref:tRNA pseudouridine(38-40) synthase TruA n=1 Tax=Alteribacillus sp. HJP-4 TaxID=2775394 RepID=UPI0035CD3B9D
MQRVKATVAYEGTFFSGWQKQPGKRTVQEEIEKAMQKVHKGTFIPVVASGRTDSGVHAFGQVIHFDTPLHVPEKRWPKALERDLPKDVQLLGAEFVSSDFHARFDAMEKEYHYRVLASRHRDIFRRNHTYFFPYPYNLEEMKRAASFIPGTRDFSSFCAANTDVEDKVRTVHEVRLEENGDELLFICRGSGFLYNMVRIIVGTLLEVGRGKRTPEDIPAMIESRKRSAAGKTAPGQGLYLKKVLYPEELEKK